MRQGEQQFGDQGINLKGLIGGHERTELHTPSRAHCQSECGTVDWLGGCEAV